MQQRYRSLHPNHVHQLAASVSKHYYAGTDGLLKYQAKPFETSLAKLADSDRGHMVIYSLRDHCSGLFYAEVGFGPKLPSMRAFLARAWRPKSHFIELPLCGVPDLMMIPQTVIAAFPDVASDIERMGVDLLDVTSGFQSGIGDLKTIEGSIGYYVGKPVDQVASFLPTLCGLRAKDKLRNTGRPKIDVWREHVSVVRMLPNSWDETSAAEPV